MEKRSKQYPYSPLLWQKAQYFAASYTYCCILSGNSYKFDYPVFPDVIACSSTDAIVSDPDFFNGKNTLQDYYFGKIEYEYSSQIASLHNTSLAVKNKKELFSFFRAELLIEKSENEIRIEAIDPDTIFKQIQEIIISYPINFGSITLQPGWDKPTYIQKVEHIKARIQQGDLYEMNLCMEFSADEVFLSPLYTWHLLQEISPMPFASFLKWEKKYTLGASPERYIRRENNKLISQPIKGTLRRNEDSNVDRINIHEFQFSSKEKSENVMIVDLVRNDLSMIAKKGSVRVEKLCAIQSFKNVHQMVSTISCKVNQKTKFKDILHATFPMGSMTGAPKISAMHHIRTMEEKDRGMFSGTIGYITPRLNFDFNVVIRSMLYDEEHHRLQLHTGSAITIYCNAEAEYDECMVKADAVYKTLKKLSEW